MKKIFKLLASSCLLLFLWLVPTQSFASYAFVQSGANNAVTAGAITASSITTSAGNSLVVWIVSLNSGAQTVTANGNTYTFKISSVTTNGAFVSLYLAQNINAGATAVATTDTGAFAIYAAEYSGLVTSGGALASQSFQQGPGGLGANILNSGSALSYASAPAAAIAITVDMAGIQTATPNTGAINAGNTLAWTTRNTNWVTNAITEARSEDFELVSTGTVIATFGTTGNKQFTNFVTQVVVIAEAGGAAPKPPKMMLMGVTKMIHHTPAANDPAISHKRAA